MTDPDEVDRQIENWETEVFNPAHRAHQMRIQGIAWKEIARQCGYGSVVTAAQAVKRYLQTAAVKQSEQKRAEALDLELDRLDQLQSKWWYAATNGDDKAAHVVLKVMAQRQQLLQLDPRETENRGGNKTILVMGKREDYVKTLQEITEGLHDEPEVDEP